MSERSRCNGGGQETTAAVWAAVSGMTVGDAWLRRDEPKSPELVTRYRDAVAQLARGVPFAYAVGSAGFRTLDLKIDRRALIPRPETEGLVELVLARCTTGLVADIGTGCGCIALALAAEGQFARVVAVERSADAAALARENVKRVSPKTPVEIRDGDLLAPLADRGERYRAIVSNPPYLTPREYAELDRSVAERHGPSLPARQRCSSPVGCSPLKSTNGARMQFDRWPANMAGTLQFTPTCSAARAS